MTGSAVHDHWTTKELSSPPVHSAAAVVPPPGQCCTQTTHPQYLPVAVWAVAVPPCDGATTAEPVPNSHPTAADSQQCPSVSMLPARLGPSPKVLCVLSALERRGFCYLQTPYLPLADRVSARRKQYVCLGGCKPFVPTLRVPPKLHHRPLPTGLAENRGLHATDVPHGEQ